LKLKQYTTAAKKYSAAIRLDATKFIGYYKRALSNVQKSSSQSALDDLDKVLELKPDYLQALIQRGNVLAALGRFKDARTQYQQVLSLSPGHTLTAKKLGTLAKGETAFTYMVQAIRRKDLAAAISRHGEALEVASESRLLNFLKVSFFFRQIFSSCSIFLHLTLSPISSSFRSFLLRKSIITTK
jgi:tetratricopeptide (TPR) repeat protein